MDFKLRILKLTHEGVIPGARGHKKQIIPVGSLVWCITYHRMIYWACYLDQGQASEAMQNLQSSVDGKARKNIDLKTMLEWNFSSAIPKRVVRPKSLPVST